MKSLKPKLRSIDDLTPDMFFHSLDTGKIRAGIQWVTSTDGVLMECFQFDTLEELQRCAKEYLSLPVMRKVSIVTHSGQYKNMRTLFTWEADAPRVSLNQIQKRGDCE